MLQPLGMPLRYRSLLLTQAASLVPVLLSDPSRCATAFARCPLAPGHYERAAALLGAAAALAPFPPALEPLRGRAACVGVQAAAQILLGLTVLLLFCHNLEVRRRAAFAIAACRPDTRLALLRKRRRWGLAAWTMFLGFAALWQLLALLLPLAWPAADGGRA